MHLISCNWLPFYRPCSFASQTFIWFADFLIIDFKLMQKNWFYYTMVLYCTQEKHYRFNVHAFVKCYCIYFLKKFQFFNFIQFSFKIMQIFYCARSQSVLNYIVVATSTKPLNFSSFKGSF